MVIDDELVALSVRAGSDLAAGGSRNGVLQSRGRCGLVGWRSSRGPTSGAAVSDLGLERSNWISPLAGRSTRSCRRETSRYVSSPPRITKLVTTPTAIASAIVHPNSATFRWGAVDS